MKSIGEKPVLLIIMDHHQRRVATVDHRPLHDRQQTLRKGAVGERPRHIRLHRAHGVIIHEAAQSTTAGSSTAMGFTELRPEPIPRSLITNGLADGRHRVYWSTTAEYVGHPEDDFESDRRERVPLASVPSLIERGEIRSANAVAALLLLHHMHAAK